MSAAHFWLCWTTYSFTYALPLFWQRISSSLFLITNSLVESYRRRCYFPGNVEFHCSGVFFQLVRQTDKTGSFFLHCQIFQGLFQSRCINYNKTEVRGKLLSLHLTERDYEEWKVWVMTWLLLLDRVNTAPGRAGESPLEGQPVLASLKHISTPTNLIRVSGEKKKRKQVQFRGLISKYFSIKNVAVFNSILAVQPLCPGSYPGCPLSL